MSGCIGIARGAGLLTQFACPEKGLVKPAPTTPLQRIAFLVRYTFDSRVPAHCCRSDNAFPHAAASRCNDTSLRSLPMDNYLILYMPIGQDVEIFRVVSGYRDLSALFTDADD